MLRDRIKHYGFCASKQEYYAILAASDKTRSMKVVLTGPAL